MGRDTPLTPDKDVIVDTNAFIAIGAPENPRFGQFRRVVHDAGVVLKLPQRVIGELGGRDTVRVEVALEEGWAEITVNTPTPLLPLLAHPNRERIGGRSVSWTDSINGGNDGVHSEIVTP